MSTATRTITLLISLASAVVLIAFLARVLPPAMASVVLDINRASWPFTVQNALWLAFFAGLGEMAIRWQGGRIEERQFERDYLPEDDETVCVRVMT